MTKRGVMLLIVGGVFGAATAGGTVAMAASSAAPASPTVKVCATKYNVVVSANARSGKCPRGTRVVSINQRGLQGARGPAGPRGATGAPGQDAAPASAPASPEPTSNGSESATIDGGTP